MIETPFTWHTVETTYVSAKETYESQAQEQEEARQCLAACDSYKAEEDTTSIGACIPGEGVVT